MTDCNGIAITVGVQVLCTDNHGNVRNGFVTRIDPLKNPPRCGGDEGDVLVVADTGEDIWTVPSDVEVL